MKIRLLVFTLMILSFSVLNAQRLEVNKGFTQKSLVDSKDCPRDNNNELCAKIVIDIPLSNVHFDCGYFVTQPQRIGNTNRYEAFVSRPKRGTVMLTISHNDYSSVQVPLWDAEQDERLSPAAEYYLNVMVVRPPVYVNKGFEWPSIQSWDDFVDVLKDDALDRKEWYVQSAFGSNGYFGLGYGFNKNHLRLGFDGMVGRGGECIYQMDKEYLEGYGFYTSKRISPVVCQLMCSPGYQTRDVSLELGLGVTLASCQTTEKSNSASWGDDKSKAYFTMRYGATVYIPLKDSSGYSNHGISVRLAYNTVFTGSQIGGGQPLNSFVLGIGFFWR